MPALARQFDHLADALNLPQGVVLVIAAGLAALAVGTIIRLIVTRRMERAKAQSLRLRARSWWVVFGMVAGAIIIGPAAVMALMAAASLLAIREFASLALDRPARAQLMAWAWVIVPGQYALVYLGWSAAALAMIPVGAVLAMTVVFTLTSRAEPPERNAARRPAGAAATDFTGDAGRATWAMILLVYFISHAPMLLTMGPAADEYEGLGLLVYLLLLTECNDIAQAIWGRAVGRRQVVPAVSPGKTWEGLIGGVATTALLAVALAPLLTPWAPSAPQATGGPPWWALPALIGLILAPAGFLGDIAMSAVKREAHVKESGNLLPGQGGMLDRIDSLTFTAPVFFSLLQLAEWPGRAP